MLASGGKERFSIRWTILRGSALAGMVLIPSFSIFAILWVMLDDLFVAAIIGGIVHFVAMGFSLKLSKKFLTRKSP